MPLPESLAVVATSPVTSSLAAGANELGRLGVEVCPMGSTAVGQPRAPGRLKKAPKQQLKPTLEQMLRTIECTATEGGRRLKIQIPTRSSHRMEHQEAGQRLQR